MFNQFLLALFPLSDSQSLTTQHVFNTEGRAYFLEASVNPSRIKWCHCGYGIYVLGCLFHIRKFASCRTVLCCVFSWIWNGICCIKDIYDVQCNKVYRRSKQPHFLCYIAPNQWLFGYGTIKIHIKSLEWVMRQWRYLCSAFPSEDFGIIIFTQDDEYIHWLFAFKNNTKENINMPNARYTLH